MKVGPRETGRGLEVDFAVRRPEHVEETLQQRGSLSVLYRLGAFLWALVMGPFTLVGSVLWAPNLYIWYRAGKYWDPD